MMEKTHLIDSSVPPVINRRRRADVASLKQGEQTATVGPAGEPRVCGKMSRVRDLAHRRRTERSAACMLHNLNVLSVQVKGLGVDIGKAGTQPVCLSLDLISD